jgi:hypothetical protein
VVIDDELDCGINCRIIMIYVTDYCFVFGARAGAVGRGIALQDGRSPVLFPMVL